MVSPSAFLRVATSVFLEIFTGLWKQTRPFSWTCSWRVMETCAQRLSYVCVTVRVHACFCMHGFRHLKTWLSQLLKRDDVWEACPCLPPDRETISHLPFPSDLPIPRLSFLDAICPCITHPSGRSARFGPLHTAETLAHFFCAALVCRCMQPQGVRQQQEALRLR